jgi:exonuclease SbcC
VSFRFGTTDLELPAQVIGIFGANGSGKSTLMESIAVALYGVSAARTKKDEVRTQGLLTDCNVRMVFEHGGSEYEVRRTIKGRNHTVGAELFLGDRQLASGVTDVDGEIERLLRMDSQVFHASVFAEQKQLDAFSNVGPAARKEMVLRLLGIRPVDDARTAARRDSKERRGAAERMTETVADMAVLEAGLKEAATIVREAAEHVKSTSKARSDAATGAKRAEEAFRASDGIREKVERILVSFASAEGERTRVVAAVAELAERVKSLEADLKQLPALRKDLAALSGANERYLAAERFSEATLTQEKLATELAKLPDEAKESAETARTLEALEQAESDVRSAVEQAATARADAGRQATQLEEALQRVDRVADADPSEPCPTCGQQLGDGFAAYVRHCKSEAAAAKKGSVEAAKVQRAAEANRKKTEHALATAEKAGTAIRMRVDRRAKLAADLGTARTAVATMSKGFKKPAPTVAEARADMERATQLGERVAQLDIEAERLAETEADWTKAAARATELATHIESLRKESDALSFDPAAHEKARARSLQAAEDLDAAVQAEREAVRIHGDAEVAAGRLEGEIKQAKELASQVEELRTDARYLERVSILLDGFRDHLVARIGPELSREAEVLFAELTNREYDDLKIDEDTLAIKIADGEDYFAIERFSGSETELANLALRVAISMHLSRMSGADVGMMVLDEVLGSLDAERKDLMVRALGRLAARFHQLFVITHAEQVKDQFPASIEIRKVSRRRSIAVLI